MNAVYDREQNAVFVRRGLSANDLFCGLSKALAQAELARTGEEYTEENAGFKAHCVSYAADRTLTGTETAAHEAAHGLDKAGRKGVKTTKENISKAKDYFQRRKADLPKKQTKDAMRRVRRSADTTQKAIKTVDRSGKTIKQTAKSTGKAAVKTTQKSIKTAEQTSRTAIKTTQAAAKTAQKTAQATAKAAKTAAQTARAAAKATAAGIKAAVKATAAAVKAIVAGTKALIAAIAAGGWIAVVVIIVICLIGLIVGSCFGIFFSGEDSGTGQTMRQAVQEINADYQSQIDTTRATIIYDELEMSGSRAVWPEVLAVYAVKTTTDPDDPQEVATVDNAKKAILKDIFWRMNELSSRTESKTDDLIANTLGTAVGFAVWFAFAKLFGQRMKTTVDGSKEAWIYIAISFCGMFFLHYPFWFAFKVAPLIWH